MAQTRSDWTYSFSSPESCDISSSLDDPKPSTSGYGQERYSYAYDSETDSDLEREYQRLVHAAENDDFLLKLNDSDLYDSASESACLDDNRGLSEEESSDKTSLKSPSSPSLLEGDDSKPINEWENDSDNSSGSRANWRYFSPASRSRFDLTESFVFYNSKNKPEDSKPDEIYSNQTSLEESLDASPVSEIVPDSLHGASSDKNDYLLSKLVPLNFIASGTSNEMNRNDYRNEDMNDVMELSDERKGKDISSFCKTEDLMELAAKKRISENSIVQELENCDCNNIISSEGCSDISELHVGIGEASFNLENSDKNLTKNPLSCIKKECKEEFDDKRESQSIPEDLNLLKTNSAASSGIVYCTQCKDSNEESNKSNLFEHGSALEEETGHEGVDTIKPRSDINALLQLFEVNNTLSRKILFLLSSSDFRNGATVTSVWNHIKNDLSGSKNKLKDDIKAFFRAATTAEIIQMRSRRYFLKTATQTEGETKMMMRKNAKTKPY